jgi:hypothetical protein
MAMHGMSSSPFHMQYARTEIITVFQLHSINSMHRNIKLSIRDRPQQNTFITPIYTFTLYSAHVSKQKHTMPFPIDTEDEIQRVFDYRASAKQ